MSRNASRVNISTLRVTKNTQSYKHCRTFALMLKDIGMTNSNSRI